MTSTMVFAKGCRTLMAAAKSSATSIPKDTKPVGILKPLPVSPALGKFLGGVSESSRPQAVKKLWAYIKGNNLQDPVNKKDICCDAKLKVLFEGKEKVTFGEISKLLSKHFIKSG
ncbi:protein TRI1 [Cornus florida]|uniref:protein TRI1 n=1 Tax=Cornus florida TaxID=4283 RepID=UPI0028968490|nr:protein TRI1 [Cornus florida]